MAALRFLLLLAITTLPMIVTAQVVNRAALQPDQGNASKPTLQAPLSFSPRFRETTRSHASDYSDQSHILLADAPNDRPSRKKGAAIGFGIGFIVGAAAFTAGRCSRFKDAFDGSCTPVGTSIAVGGTIGGLFGAGIGFLAQMLRGSQATPLHTP
jgi:hypothetical protein